MTAAARDRDEPGALATLPAGRACAAALALEARAPATRRAYRAAIGRLDATLAGRPLADATLAEHVSPTAWRRPRSPRPPQPPPSSQGSPAGPTRAAP